MSRAGVDTGGTFTDFVFLEDGKLKIKKILSTPQNPALAVIKGIGDRPCFLVHGTTVATNAFLEGKTAKTALLTTEGFRHILQIGRQTRVNLYSLVAEKPPEIIPESLCFGVKERTLADGSVETPFNETNLEEISKVLTEKGVEAVAVVFIHSYRNPEHEIRAGKFLDRKFKVSLSHQVLNEHREYERAVVTALNASLLPVMENYISYLEENINGTVNIMNSAGGYISAESTKKMPVLTLLSGPAGGVIASLNMGKLIGVKNMITLDMGGTSTDVSLIKGNPIITRSAMLSNIPIRIPMIEIQTVGAGGGSIARVDEGGALKVGPQSAGADPGPACYGKTEIPTITDAFVVLGRIAPEIPLGGDLRIKPERSFDAIEKIALQISKNVYETAEGILEVSLVKMERALKIVSLEKGEDPREFSLVAFGGAGGLVAAELALRMGMKEVIIPPNQGVFSAFGMLLADSVREYTTSMIETLSSEAIKKANHLFEELYEKAREEFSFSAGNNLVQERFVEMRYRGQGYEISVPYSDDQSVLKRRFEELHQKLYFHIQDSPVEMVNLRLRVTLISEKPSIPVIKQGELKPFEGKEIYFRGRKWKALFYRKEELGAGVESEGPCIIASNDGTIFVPPGFLFSVGKYGEIRIWRENV